MEFYMHICIGKDAYASTSAHLYVYAYLQYIFSFIFLNIQSDVECLKAEQFLLFSFSITGEVDYHSSIIMII